VLKYLPLLFIGVVGWFFVSGPTANTSNPSWATRREHPGRCPGLDRDGTCASGRPGGQLP
jgi:hypothetical protein